MSSYRCVQLLSIYSITVHSFMDYAAKRPTHILWVYLLGSLRVVIFYCVSAQSI